MLIYSSMRRIKEYRFTYIYDATLKGLKEKIPQQSHNKCRYGTVFLHIVYSHDGTVHEDHVTLAQGIIGHEHVTASASACRNKKQKT